MRSLTKDSACYDCKKFSEELSASHTREIELYARLSKDKDLAHAREIELYARLLKDTDTAHAREMSDKDAAHAHQNKLQDEIKSQPSAPLRAIHGMLVARGIIEDVVRQEFLPHCRTSTKYLPHCRASTIAAARIAAEAPEFMAYLATVGQATGYTARQLSSAISETYEHLSSCIHVSITVTFPVERVHAKSFASRAAAVGVHAFSQFYGCGNHLPFMDFDGTIICIPPAPPLQIGLRLAYLSHQPGGRDHVEWRDDFRRYF